MASISLGANPREALGALGGGLLGACAFPPVGLWPLGLVAPTLLLVLIRDRSTTDARNLGLLYGIALAAGTMHWFIGLFGVLAISLLALFGVLGHRSEAVNPHGVPSKEGVAIGEKGSVIVEFAHRGGWTLGGQMYHFGPICAGGTVVFGIVWGIGRWRRRRALNVAKE